MTADPNTLTVHQGKTFRIVFAVTDTAGTPSPLAGYGARFVVLDRAGGNILLSVDDTMTGDALDPDNLDVPVAIEPDGAIGEVHVRLGADQTALLLRDAVYDAAVYSTTDPTEVQPLDAGPLAVILQGADQ